MTARIPFTYVVLRYRPDAITEQFVNVGVVLHCAERSFVRGRFLLPGDRARRLFPGADVDAVCPTIRHLQRCFEVEHTRLARLVDSPSADQLGSAESVATAALPRDDSALQWSAQRGGIARDPGHALDDLFERLVGVAAEDGSRQRDDAAWSAFSDALRAHSLECRYAPFELEGDPEPIVFEGSWSIGGYRRCIKALSFDLQSRDAILDKAYRIHGLFSGAAISQHLVFVVSPPREGTLLAAYEQAKRVLRRISSADIFDDPAAFAAAEKSTIQIKSRREWA